MSNKSRFVEAIRHRDSNDEGGNGSEKSQSASSLGDVVSSGVIADAVGAGDSENENEDASDDQDSGLVGVVSANRVIDTIRENIETFDAGREDSHQSAEMTTDDLKQIVKEGVNEGLEEYKGTSESESTSGGSRFRSKRTALAGAAGIAGGAYLARRGRKEVEYQNVLENGSSDVTSDDEVEATTASDDEAGDSEDAGERQEASTDDSEANEG